MKPRFKHLSILFSLLIVATLFIGTVKGAPTNMSEMNDRLYVCWPTDDAFQYASKEDSNLLVNDVFYLYQTYGWVSVSYTKDNVIQYDGNNMLSDTWIRCTLMEGGHLIVKSNNTVIYDGFTWNANDPGNTFKYKFGIVEQSVLVSFLASLPLAAFLIIMKYSRKNIYVIGGSTKFNKDEEVKN